MASRRLFVWMLLATAPGAVGRADAQTHFVSSQSNVWAERRRIALSTSDLPRTHPRRSPHCLGEAHHCVWRMRSISAP